MTFIIKRIDVLQRVLPIVEVLILEPAKTCDIFVIVKVNLDAMWQNLRRRITSIINRTVISIDT